MSETLALKDHSLESRLFMRRALVGFACTLLLSGVLAGRLFYLQVVRHDVYVTLSDKNRIHVQSVPPTRGLIHDRNGTLLADNVPSYVLTLVPERVDDVELALQQLDELIGLDESDVRAFRRRLKYRRPFESVAVRLRLSEMEVVRVSINRHRLPGVQIEASLVRHYPFGELMVHAVGSVRRINEDDLARIDDKVAYAGTNHIGKTGAERLYEKKLLGEVGYQWVETNAHGRVMNVLESRSPVPGADLVLHIDAGLQQVASAALGDRRGAIVAMEPATGGLLAVVSKPAYDPNLFVTGVDAGTYKSWLDSADTPLFNRALQGQYEPGSTVKPFIGLIALTQQVVDRDHVIEDPGYFRLPNEDRLYRDWNWNEQGEHGGHGLVDLERAIYRSCNVYFYRLAVEMGIDLLHQELGRFGFGRNLSVDMPHSGKGLMPSPDWKRKTHGEAWYPGDTVNVGIGQGAMLVTPLQLVTAVSVLANRGRVVRPRLLLDAGSGFAAADAEEVVPGRPEDWDYVIGAMEQVVHRGNRGFGENGTAWAYIGRDIPYRMAGKSGTAQVVGIKQGEEYDEEALDERLREHAWFVAFAPVEAPRIAVAVLVENGGGGSLVAAPVAREVIDAWLLGSRPVLASRAGVRQ